MDYLEYGYTSAARWQASGDATILLRWYRAAPGAQVYEKPHAFGSTVWDDPELIADTGPGEIPGRRPWSPSVTPLYDGTQPAYIEDYLLDGVPLDIGSDSVCCHGNLAFNGSYSAVFPCLLTESLSDILKEDLTGCIQQEF